MAETYVELEVAAEVIQEGHFASKYNFIITFAPLNHENFINFNTNLPSHSVLNGHEITIADDLDVELAKHALRIVRIRRTKHSVIVVDFHVS